MSSSDFSSVSRERLAQLRKGLFENGKFRSCRLSIVVKPSVNFCVFPMIPSRYPPGIIGGCSLHTLKHTGEGIDEIGQLSLSLLLPHTGPYFGNALTFVLHITIVPWPFQYMSAQND